MANKVLLATMDTFTKAGRFVPRGNPIAEDEVDFEGEESRNLTEAPKELQDNQPVMEISAIAPTGPNPTAPQQIAPDVVQTVAGYEQQGVRLVGEVTVPEKKRIQVVGIDDEKAAEAQAAVNEKLQEAAEEQRNYDLEQQRLAETEASGDEPEKKSRGKKS